MFLQNQQPHLSRAKSQSLPSISSMANQMSSHRIPSHQIPPQQIPHHQIPHHQISPDQIPHHQIPYHQIPHHQIPLHQIPHHQHTLLPQLLPGYRHLPFVPTGNTGLCFTIPCETVKLLVLCCHYAMYHFSVYLFEKVSMNFSMEICGYT